MITTGNRIPLIDHKLLDAITEEILNRVMIGQSPDLLIPRIANYLVSGAMTQQRCSTAYLSGWPRISPATAALSTNFNIQDNPGLWTPTRNNTRNISSSSDSVKQQEHGSPTTMPATTTATRKIHPLMPGLDVVTERRFPASDRPTVPKSDAPIILNDRYDQVVRTVLDKHAKRKERPVTCVFCKKNGEIPDFYMRHNLKDGNGNVICPVLRRYRCPICCATGLKAHTVKYCPMASNAM